MYDENEDEYVEERSPEMQIKKWSPGYLYILDYGDGKQFKIGITRGDPTTRANQIKRNSGHLMPNPISSELVVTLKMDTNPYYLEQLLHMTYEYRHVGGEWFELDDTQDIVGLVAMVKPFGRLKYYPRWYSYFDETFLSFVVAGTYSAELDYSKDIEVYSLCGAMYVQMKDDNKEELERVLKRYRKDRKNHERTFEHAVVLCDYRTEEERAPDMSDFVKGLEEDHDN